MASQSKRRLEAEDPAAKTKQSIDHELEPLVEKMRGCIGDCEDTLSYLAKRRQIEGREGDRIQVPPWWYPIALLLVGVVEWMLNYSAFLDSFSVPAVAGGLTILVAAMVAFASHEHGTAAKQWKMKFRQSGDQGSLASWLLFGFATFGLVVSLALVAWVRYTWVESLMARGVGDLAILPKVLQTLGGNLIVWLIGAMVAFWAHDASPKLQSNEKARRKLKAALKKAKKKLRKAITKHRMRFELEGEEKSEAAKIATNAAIAKVMERVGDLDHQIHREVFDIVDFSHQEIRQVGEDQRTNHSE